MATATDTREGLTAAKGRMGAFAKTSPGLTEGVVKVSTAATVAGRFASARKELIATGIAVAKSCEDCFLDHVGGAHAPVVAP